MTIRQLATDLERLPGIGGALRFIHRALQAGRSLWRPVVPTVTWLFTSRERTNYTFRLTEVNLRYLAATIADIVESDHDRILAYMNELEEDAELKAYIAAATRERGGEADPDARYGKRAGWYAIVRAVKPRVIVETGVDKGLGACVLTCALRRNGAEGHPGRYFGTDINPRAGWLLGGEYASHGEILYGDSLESLRAFDGTIDVFVNDSDHSQDYEAKEYRTVDSKLTTDAIILGDNAHCSDRLLEFALETGRSFVFFREEPKGHWYSGGGVGFAFRRKRGGDDRDLDGRARQSPGRSST